LTIASTAYGNNKSGFNLIAVSAAVELNAAVLEINLGIWRALLDERELPAVITGRLDW
jgi:hypothetical protein